VRVGGGRVVVWGGRVVLRSAGCWTRTAGEPGGGSRQTRLGGAVELKIQTVRRCGGSGG
jgi:hypothetical protein